MIRKILIGLFAVLVFAGAMGLHRDIREYLAKPDVRTWSRVDQYVYQHSSAEDGVLFLPFWLAGYALDLKRFQYISIYEKAKLVRQRTDLPDNLWVLRIAGENGLEKELRRLGYSLEETRLIDSVRCERYINRSWTALFDMSEQLPKAAVRIDYADGRRDAGVWGGQAFRFQSNTAEWNAVGVRAVTYSFGRERRNAVWFHPVKTGTKIIEFRGVPLGNQLSLLLGLADSGRRYDRVVPVYFSVSVNGRSLGRFKIDERNAEQYWAFEMAPYGAVGDVEFKIEGGDDIDSRHIFFKAATRQRSKER